MSSPRTTHLSSSSITSEHFRDARAWAYVFECYRKNEAATSPVSRPGDAERSLSDGARDIIRDTK
jgi:hypothetical protein